MGTPVVAVGNHKGGSGKSITTHYLAHLWARAGRRVLAVDLDDQGTLSARCGVEEPGTTVADLLVGDGAEICRGQLWAAQGRGALDRVPAFDLIPADYRLAWAAAKMQASAPNHAFLRRALAGLAGEYDAVLLDLPPSAGIVVINALCAATHLLLAATPTVESVEGIARMKRMVDDVRDAVGSAPEVVGVAATQAVVRTVSHAEHLAALGNEVLGVIPLRLGQDAGAQLMYAYEPLADAVWGRVTCSKG